MIWPNQDAPGEYLFFAETSFNLNVIIKFLNIFYLAGFECSFESDKCGWIVTADSNVNWVRKNGRTYWGPSIDQYSLILNFYNLTKVLI